MQMHRLLAVGRLALVMSIVVVSGCSEGEWDWFGLKKTEPKDKQVAKARRPVKSEASTAESRKKPATSSDDAKSREVDDKVERYVRSMNTQYDPDYKNNDFSSKISRQRDPDRAARVRQTAIRSRTEPTLDEAAAQVPDRPSGEEPLDSETSSPASAGGSPVGDTVAETQRSTEQPSPQEKPLAAREELKEKNPSNDDAKPAPSESAMKPPVLSEVTVSASPARIDPKPGEQEQKEAEPVQLASAEPKPEEPKPVAPAPVKTAPIEEKPVSQKPIEQKRVETETIKPKPRPAPQRIEPAPQETAPKPEPKKPEQNATVASSNVPTRIETPPVEALPVEEKRAESKRSEPPPAETPTVQKVSETPIVKKKHVANTPSSPPPQPVDTFKKKLKDQEALVARNPDDVEEQFKLRMMYLVDGQDEKALATSTSMNAETQEILLGQIRALMAARTSTSRDSAVWANQQLAAIEKLRGLLRAKADLMVPKVELCKSIEGFGRYEPIEPAAFKSGAKNRVLLYIEVDNFQCEKTTSGLFRTLLSVRESLLNKSGEELWSAKDDNIEDLARQKRRDFYLTIGPLAIPKSLGPGEYVFKVEVEDVLGGKINSNVVRFKMTP